MNEGFWGLEKKRIREFFLGQGGVMNSLLFALVAAPYALMAAVIAVALIHPPVAQERRVASPKGQLPRALLHKARAGDDEAPVAWLRYRGTLTPEQRGYLQDLGAFSRQFRLLEESRELAALKADSEARSRKIASLLERAERAEPARGAEFQRAVAAVLFLDPKNETALRHEAALRSGK